MEKVNLYVMLRVQSDSVSDAISASRSVIEIVQPSGVQIKPRENPSDIGEYVLSIFAVREVVSESCVDDAIYDVVESTVVQLGLASGYSELRRGEDFTIATTYSNLPSQAAVLFPDCREFLIEASSDINPVDNY
ncbi:hypothetical protein [Actinopolyspora saharensis]|uniref:hypothetical protein n=1 Tax=Actinopolyspora saharensis TaxID=995062 RepID=UPI003F66634D